jgi:hypothetical protein
MKKVSLFLLCSIFLSQLLAQGIKFDEAKYKQIKSFEISSAQGFSEAELPARISYRAYCPKVRNQGGTATCVGWAIAYCQLTTQQQILMGDSSSISKSFRGMDPYFLYALSKNVFDEDYSEGVFMGDTYEKLIDYGTKPLLSDPIISTNFISKFTENTFDLSSRYAPINYLAFNDTMDLINQFKNALTQGKPIAVGLYLNNSFFNGKGVQFGLWNPKKGEEKDSSNLYNGHAMCIIGYDDEKQGGCFELMNSYGSDFGDNGFVWIKYKDLLSFLGEAYIVNLDNGPNGFRNNTCSFGDCNQIYSRYTYKNGEIYEGYFSNGLRDRYGILFDNRENVYIGEFSGGKRHGLGIYFDLKKNKMYPVNYSFGKKIKFTNSQGFAGDPFISQLILNFELTDKYKFGEKINFNTDEYEDFLLDESSNENEEPLKAE